MWAPFLLLFFSISTCHCSTLPSIEFPHLKNGLVRDTRNKIGAFVITHMEDKYQNAVRRLFSEAPECLGSHPGLPRLELNDGSYRTTFATMTGQEGSLECLTGPMEVIEEAFDLVDDLVAEVIQNVTGPLLYRDGPDIFKLNQAPVKSHVHVYEKGQRAMGG